jgi:hypothetical protein
MFSPRSRKTRSFFKTQIGTLILCLLISDLIQSLAGILQLHWTSRGSIMDDGSCELQGASLMLGNIGTGIFSAMISVLTFLHVVMRKDTATKTWYTTAMVSIGCGIAIVLNLIGPLAFNGNKGAEWFGIAGGWCFITSDFLLPRILLHYPPLFLCAFVILVMYTLTFLHLRGYHGYDNGKFSWSLHRPTGAGIALRISTSSKETFSVDGDQSIKEAYIRRTSKKLMLYPLMYILLIPPDSSARLAALMGKTAPEWFWYLGIAAMFSMGVFFCCRFKN